MLATSGASTTVHWRPFALSSNGKGSLLRPRLMATDPHNIINYPLLQCTHCCLLDINYLRIHGKIRHTRSVVCITERAWCVYLVHELAPSTSARTHMWWFPPMSLFLNPS